MKIHELADELNLPRKIVLGVAQELGIEAKATTKQLTTEQETRVRQVLSNEDEAFENDEVDAASDTEEVAYEVKEDKEAPLENEGAFSEAFEAPRQKKKTFGFGKKSDKERGVKLQMQKYSRPSLPKAHSQKGARVLLGTLAVVVVLVAVGSSLSYSRAKRTVQSESRDIIEAGKQSVKSISMLKSKANYEAQIFTEEFARAFLNFSDDPKSQEKQIKDLEKYYGKKLPLASQGVKRMPSQLKGIKLLSIEEGEAKFLVDVSTKKVEKIPAKGKEKAKTKTIEDTVKKVFHVFYAEKDGKYYISSFPILEDIPSAFLGDKAPQIDLTASSEVSSEEKEKLNTFVKNVLVAKTTGEKDLKILASGLELSTGQNLKSIDYFYYKKMSDNTYKAVIQASFENTLGIVPENLVFTIEKSDKAYFAKDFSHVIKHEDLNK